VPDDTPRKNRSVTPSPSSAVPQSDEHIPPVDDRLSESTPPTGGPLNDTSSTVNGALPDGGSGTVRPEDALPDDVTPAGTSPDSAVPKDDAEQQDGAAPQGGGGAGVGGLVTANPRAGEDDPITAHTDAVAATRHPEPQVPAHVRALEDGGDGLTPDPLLDMEQRRREAGADKLSPFGRPGQPLGRTHPFVFGFTAALGVICAWLLFQAVTSARQVIVLIVVSMFLAVGLNPAVERLQRARLPRGGAVAVVFLGLVLAFVGVGFAVIPPLTEQITNFIDHLPTYIQQLGENQRVQELDREYQVLQKAQDAVTNPNFGQSALDGVVGVGRVLLGGIVSTLTVLILTLYFLSSLPTIKTFFYRLAPRSRRARVALLGDEILLRIGGYVAGTITVAFIAGTMAYIFLSIMDVSFALPLALFVGITALIPLVGATIGAVLACIVAFFDGTFTGIACVIFFLVYQQIENYIIHPRVMKRAVDVQPAVTIIAALIGGTLLGIVGALLAIPTAAALALIIREVVVPRQDTM
jgi:predicted PurR-regulated permease PerM